MKRAALIILIMVNASIAHASDAENIMACVNKANEFVGVKLNEFEAAYEGRFLSMSTAKWKNAYCEVKLRNVYNLQVNGNQIIYKGFAGKDAYDLNHLFEEKTEAAINQLKSRIALLEQRMNQVTVSLQGPNPDPVSLTRYIDEGIEKSIGVERQAPASTAATAQDLPRRPKAQPEAPIVTNKTPAASLSVEACVIRGVAYFKEIGSYPTLSTAPNAGRSAEDVTRERCNRTTTAF